MPIARTAVWSAGGYSAIYSSALSRGRVSNDRALQPRKTAPATWLCSINPARAQIFHEN